MVGTAATHAQDWPRKPIRVICPFAPGGATDLVARLYAQRLQAALMQNVVVDNRSGAGGAIGADIAAKAEADGHTLLFTSESPITIGPNLYRNTPYDPLKDFSPVGRVVSVALVLVANPRQKIASVGELIKQARERKSAPLKYASSGAGAVGHLSGELFKAATSTDLLHVPYKGGGPAIAGLIGGETDLSFATYASVIPHVKSGRLALLAVSNSKRSRLLPDTLTIAEAGVPGYGVDNWHGLLAPPGVPAAVLNSLDRETAAIVGSKDFSDAVNTQGAEVDHLALASFGAFIRKEHARWKQVIEKNRIKVD
jgi:tripartite-type tricarboxylate transporter receptor subunit TctC